MRIDEELYIKSRAIIKDRTADYEAYIRRRISVNRAELLRKQIDELDAKRAALMKEYDYEVELQSTTKTRTVDELTSLICRMIDRQGLIGLNQIDDIAFMNGLNPVELKTAIPEQYKDKFVKFYETPERSPFDEIGGV